MNNELNQNIDPNFNYSVPHSVDKDDIYNTFTKDTISLALDNES